MNGGGPYEIKPEEEYELPGDSKHLSSPRMLNDYLNQINKQ